MKLLCLDEVITGHGRPLVGPLSFAIRRGEIVGLWGPNGVGKSTLLGAITGERSLFGGRIHKAPGLRLGLLPQQPLRLEEMPISGAELLSLMEADPAPPAPLRGCLGQRIDRLSGGQFQLLRTWAVATAPADLLLLDEPTNNLDPQAGEQLIGILERQRPRRGMLLVSHERDVVERLCDRVIRLPGDHCHV